MGSYSFVYEVVREAGFFRDRSCKVLEVNEILTNLFMIKPRSTVKYFGQKSRQKHGQTIA